MNHDERDSLIFWLIVLGAVLAVIVVGIFIDDLCPAYLCPPMGFQ